MHSRAAESHPVRYPIPRCDAAPVPVSVPCVELHSFEEAVATIRIVCSAGFYVRALAHTAGERTGTGACLQALRRVRSGDFTLSDAVTIDELQRAPVVAASVRAVIMQEPYSLRSRA